MKQKISKILENRDLRGEKIFSLNLRLKQDYRRKLDCIKKAENISKDVDYIRQMIDAHYKLIKGDMS